MLKSGVLVVILNRLNVGGGNSMNDLKNISSNS